MPLADADALEGQFRAKAGGKLAAHGSLSRLEGGGGAAGEGGIALRRQQVDGPAVIAGAVPAHLQAAGIRIDKCVEMQVFRGLQPGDGDIVLRRKALHQGLCAR